MAPRPHGLAAMSTAESSAFARGMIVKAIAYKSGMADSGVAEAMY